MTPNPGMTDLLVECCRQTPDLKFIGRRLAELERPEALVELSYRHGILPLVYRALSHPDANASDALKAELKAHNLDIARSNMLLGSELIRLATAFEAEGLTAVFFKGPLLSQAAYGDLTSRMFADLDLHTDEADLHAAGMLLERLGYVCEHPVKFLTNRALLKAGKDVGFRHATSGVRLELHWKLFETRLIEGDGGVQYDLLAPHAVAFQGRRILTLGTDATLLYLCLHGAKHFFERIEWVADIDRMVRTHAIDWEAVVQNARALRCERRLSLALGLSEALFDTPLPQPLRRYVGRDRHAAKLGHLVRDNHLHGRFEGEPQGLEGIFSHIGRTVGLSDSKSAWLTYTARILFELKPADAYCVNLPRYAHPAYHLIRPFRLLFDYTVKRR